LASGAHYLETFDGPRVSKSRQLGGDPQLVIQEPGEDLRRAAAEKTAKKLSGGDLFSGPLSS
jgi:hypothetical protein